MRHSPVDDEDTQGLLRFGYGPMARFSLQAPHDEERQHAQYAEPTRTFSIEISH